jgi:sec-independent protein translocase protein TatB
MFDIGFSELMVIAVVALIVIGPERLPRVARTLGHLFGRMQRYVNDVKADINREMQFEELKKLQAEMESTARSLETSVNDQVKSAEDELNRIAAAASADPAPLKPEPPAAGVTTVAPAGEIAADGAPKLAAAPGDRPVT